MNGCDGASGSNSVPSARYESVFAQVACALDERSRTDPLRASVLHESWTEVDGGLRVERKEGLS